MLINIQKIENNCLVVRHAVQPPDVGMLGKICQVYRSTRKGRGWSYCFIISLFTNQARLHSYDLIRDIKLLERIQRRATKYILNDFINQD